MEFINKMKKREFIEMGLKTLIAVLSAFLAIILMEGMIYGITLNQIKAKTSETKINNSTIAYCLKEAEDKYTVIFKNYDENTDEFIWTCMKDKTYTKAQCDAMEGIDVKEVKFHAPNAFELSITSPVHYVIMAVFVSAVAGFFVYKFIKLSKDYQKIEDEFNKTGTIALSNM